jgi:hypothetical protein
MTTDGWLYVAPTVNEGPNTLIVQVKDSANAVAQATFTHTIDSVLAIMGTAISASSQPLPAAMVGNKYFHQMSGAGGSGAGFAWADPAVTLPPGLAISNSGAITGTPTGTAGNVTGISLHLADNGGHAALATFSMQVMANANVARPSYNSITANGFFVLNGKLYDPNGAPFYMRGFNRNHFDNSSQPGLSLSGANTCRFFMFTMGAGGTAASVYANVASTQHIAFKELPIITAALFPGGTVATSGSADTTQFSNLVNWWVSNVSAFASIMNSISVNIANEWGPSNSTIWRDSYISAISSMRTAGYTCPIVIDAGGFGQDEADLTNFAPAVFASDPLKNIVFSFHAYGGTTTFAGTIASIAKGTSTTITLNSGAATHPFAPTFNGSNNSFSGIPEMSIVGAQGMTQINGNIPTSQNVGGSPGAWTITANVNSTGFGSYTGGGTIFDFNHYSQRIPRLASLASSTGAVVMVGEFGPGKNIGPSPTLVSPGEIVVACEASGVPWLAWAWDDNDMSGGMTSENWFGATLTAGVYTKPSDLTFNGQEETLNPEHGVTSLSAPASFFLGP